MCLPLIGIWDILRPSIDCGIPNCKLASEYPKLWATKDLKTDICEVFSLILGFIFCASKIPKKYSLLRGKSNKINGSSLIRCRSISLNLANLWLALTNMWGGTLISGIKDIFLGRLKLYVIAKSILPLII